MTELSIVPSNKSVDSEGDDKLRESLFLLLKQAIKARGYTYRQLAVEMGVSEVSIKRLFKDKDCKMSRLFEICSIVDVSIDELIQMQQRFKQTPEFLSESTERVLAANKPLFVLLVFLLSQLDIATVQRLLKLEREALYIQLRALEKLEIIELLTGEKYRFTIPLPVRWRMGGALSDLIIGINQRYIEHCISNETNPDYAFTTTSRLMTKSSIEQVQKKLRKIKEEYDYLSTQDQMFYQAEDLELCKLVFALGPMPMQVIFEEVLSK
jgi:DNA-binding Xre family transcriptional regulator